MRLCDLPIRLVRLEVAGTAHNRACRRYYARNREREAQRKRLYYLANSEAIKERGKRWRRANPHKMREIRRLQMRRYRARLRARAEFARQQLEVVA